MGVIHSLICSLTFCAERYIYYFNKLSTIVAMHVGKCTYVVCIVGVGNGGRHSQPSSTVTSIAAVVSK